MAWTVAVAAVAITAGVIASSIDLIGLGLEAVIEMLAAAIVIWQLCGSGEDRQTQAIRLISATFPAAAEASSDAGENKAAEQGPPRLFRSGACLRQTLNLQILRIAVPNAPIAPGKRASQLSGCWARTAVRSSVQPGGGRMLPQADAPSRAL
jgi:hypothetical protein